MEEFEIPSFEINEEVTPEVDVTEENPLENLPEVDVLDEETEIAEVEENSDLVNNTYNYYKEQGFFTSLGEHDVPTTPEELMSLIDSRAEIDKTSLRKEVESEYLTSLPEWAQPIMKAVQDSQEPITKETFNNLLQDAAPSSLQESDLDDLEAAKSFYKESLIAKGFTEEIANDTIDTLVDNKNLIKVAKSEFKSSETSRANRVNDFVENVEISNKQAEKELEDFRSGVVTSIKESGYRKDIIESNIKYFEKGQFKERMENWLSSPKGLNSLIMLSRYWDGKEFNFEALAPIFQTKPTTKVVDKLRSIVSSSSNTNRTVINNNEDESDRFDPIL